MIENAKDISSNESSYGLPQKLATTYDHFGFHTHDTVAYNGHIYLTALVAVEAMAKLMGDSATAANVTKALALGKPTLRIACIVLCNDRSLFPC